MNKAELTKKAESLNVDIESTWTNREIEAAIAEKEQEVVVTTKDFKNPEVEGNLDKPAVVEAKAEEPNRTQEPNRAVIENKPDEAKKPKSKDDGVIVKYKGESASFQIGRYKFSDKEPFVIVSKEFADTLDEENPDLEISSKKELDQFYAE